MPGSDPFDKLEELFDDNAPASPGYTPTRQEPTVPKGVLRTPTRAEAIRIPSGRTPTRSEGVADDSQPYRPSGRPPLAQICICDDGADDGEWMRIRQVTFVIGRAGSDLNIPFDPIIAPRHAEISVAHEAGKHVWHLTDLHSPTGTFVAVAERPLKAGSELWVGGRRYRFEQSSPGALPTLRDLSDPHARVFVLDPPGVDFGREPAAGRLTVSDPCLAKRHARFEVTPNGGWKVVSLGGRNGVYVRVERVRFGTTCKFQLGEQRFIVRVMP